MSMRMKRSELRERRKALGMSQEALARAVGVTMQVVHAWEKGLWGMSPANEAKVNAFFKAAEKAK